MSVQNITRTAQTANFTIIPNAIWNTGLSVAAVSALGYLLSKPPTWRLRITDLRNKLGIGRDRIYKALNELVRAGYAKMTRLQRGVRWQFFDTPQTDATPDTAEPIPKSRLPEIQFTEKPEAIERNEIHSLVSNEKQQQTTEPLPDPIEPITPIVVVSTDNGQSTDPVLVAAIETLPITTLEKQLAARTLSNFTLDECKAVLSVYAGALVRGGISNRIGYLVGLVKAAKNGTLTLSTANNQLSLDQRLAKERQRKAEESKRGVMDNEQWAAWFVAQYGVKPSI